MMGYIPVSRELLEDAIAAGPMFGEVAYTTLLDSFAEIERKLSEMAIDRPYQPENDLLPPADDARRRAKLPAWWQKFAGYERWLRDGTFGFAPAWKLPSHHPNCRCMIVPSEPARPIIDDHSADEARLIAMAWGNLK